MIMRIIKSYKTLLNNVHVHMLGLGDAPAPALSKTFSFQSRNILLSTILMSFPLKLNFFSLFFAESANDGCFSPAYKFPSSVIIPKVSIQKFFHFRLIVSHFIMSKNYSARNKTKFMDHITLTHSNVFIRKNLLIGWTGTLNDLNNIRTYTNNIGYSKECVDRLKRSICSF